MTAVPVNGEEPQMSDDKQPGVFDVLTVLGHDLKSPINAVESYLELIRGRVLGDTLDPYAEILDNSIARLHHMRTLISDVVDWARLDAPPETRRSEDLDLSKTARAAIAGHEAEARERGITIASDIEDSLSMKAVPKEIELILHHLLDNAVKYNRDNGSVRISVRREGAGISLKVSDTGIGMTADELGRLFQEFTRIKNDRTRDIRGTGLGLAVVRKILHLCRGTVEVESDPGKGTTFFITLPMH